METPAPAAAKQSGLSTVVNTIASPSEAFETLRTAPTWGWALIFAIILMIVGTYLQGPAARHAGVVQTQQMMSTNSFFASLTPAQKQEAIARAGRPSPWAYVTVIFVLFFAALFNSLIMLIGNAVGRGQAGFKQLWAGSMNIAVPTLGLGAVVLGIITMLRSPDSFNSTLDVVKAMPSLAYLAPHASAATVAFLSSISVFTLWGLFLNATMLRVTGRTSSGVAYGFAALVTLLGAVFAAGGVAMLHNFGMG
ncbi:MAG TPA: hypothetical protein VFO29_01490 [Candidatus Rubrimentiphilum sp.]|nr:hypothetical protein [Candidatus Rubrimentiphilum sp.]